MTDVTFEAWLQALRARRQRWADASRENDFDRGIWNATVEKYADPTHFIFELLQNAEDAGATGASFRLDADAISFEHDGRPFGRDDIEGVTGIGNTTKIDEANKIGCFGIGFKSVYVITDAPEIHCRIEERPSAFTIRDLVVPEIIQTNHDRASTLIRLPLRQGRGAALLDQVRAALRASAPRSLLFLHNLRSVSWSDGIEGASSEADSVGDIRVIRTKGKTGLSSERFLLVSRPVIRSDDTRSYTVKIAFRLNDGGEIVPEPSPTPLAVYFDTEDLTGLHFQVHGPFQLTDNRANVKREDPWNQLLVRELAELLATALPQLRERGLVRRSFLEVLPHGSDELPEIWEPLRSAVLKVFRDEALLPTHSSGHVKASQAVRGPADVREAIGDDGLEGLAGLKGARWVLGGLRGSRTEAFLAALSAREFGLAELIDAFRGTLGFYWRSPERIRAETWIESLSDERLQRFYLLLDQATRQKRPGLDGIAFVRLESGQYVRPSEARLPPSGGGVDDELGSLRPKLVKLSLLKGGRTRGADVRQFLERVGVPEIDEGDWIAGILSDHYAPSQARPTLDRHLQHVRRFVRYFEETGNTGPLKNVRWLRAEGIDGMFTPAQIFLPPPFAKNQLERIYGGRVPSRDRRPLWTGYSRLKRRDQLVKMLTDAGAEAKLSVYHGEPRRNPGWRELSAGFGATRVTGSGVSDDFIIPDLAAILALRDAEVCRMLWNSICELGAYVMWARWSPNQSREPNRCLSQLALVLRDAEWIPAADGTFRKPSSITSSELAQGFPLQPALKWLEAIGFGADHRQRSELHQARRKAAESIGLTSELADRLQSMSKESRAALAAEMMRRISDGAFTSPEFPEREAANPQRRAQRVAQRAEAAPGKVYEVKSRSVRVTGGDTREMARIYLRDLYTNDAGQMICQGCRLEMPFRLESGEHYFEAATLLSSLSVELSENHLAMCPTCAAKWQHARGTPDSDLLEGLQASEVAELKVTLAGAPVALRFVQLHFEDLRAAFEGLGSAPGGAAQCS
jgi:hypothetical protein